MSDLAAALLHTLRVFPLLSSDELRERATEVLRRIAGAIIERGC